MRNIHRDISRCIGIYPYPEAAHARLPEDGAGFEQGLKGG